MIEFGNHRRLVEAKAGQTASEDMLSVARRIRAGLDDMPCQAVVVYGGQDRQTRQDVLLLPWDEVDREAWAQ